MFKFIKVNKMWNQSDKNKFYWKCLKFFFEIANAQIFCKLRIFQKKIMPKNCLGVALNDLRVKFYNI